MEEVAAERNFVKKEESLLSWKEKFAFFLVNMGNIPLMTLLGSFLLIYYTDVVGLNPTVVGTLFLVSRIFDGVNDPIMGYVIDHLPRTKLGKFRSYLIHGYYHHLSCIFVDLAGSEPCANGKDIPCFSRLHLIWFCF